MIHMPTICDLPTAQWVFHPIEISIRLSTFQIVELRKCIRLPWLETLKHIVRATNSNSGFSEQHARRMNNGLNELVKEIALLACLRHGKSMISNNTTGIL